MVSPVYLIALPMFAAFLLPVLGFAGRRAARAVFYVLMFVLMYISGSWLYSILANNSEVMIFTAGFKPPLSINLRLGLEEALFLFSAHLVAFLSAFYLRDRFTERGTGAMMLFLMLTLGVSGIIMTRDLFNLFVFMEIASIATYALIGLDGDAKSLQAGFKYMIAGGIASLLYLVGTVYLYRITGTLNLDGMIGSGSGAISAAAKAGFFAVFLLSVSIVIEMKPFPANGWALDVYQAAPAPVAAVVSAAGSGAMFFALYKILPILPLHAVSVIAGAGLVTFFFSNLLGLRQSNVKRMLGYSSVAQMGLLAAAASFGHIYALPPSLMMIVAGGLFVNHLLAKAGLFWFTGLGKFETVEEYRNAVRHPVVAAVFGVFVFSLVGLPPFPGFWAKWELVKVFLSGGASQAAGVDGAMILWLVFLFAGSLFEAIYLFRWFGTAVTRRSVSAEDAAVSGGTEAAGAAAADGAVFGFAESYAPGLFNSLPLVLSALLLAVLGLGAGYREGAVTTLFLLPFAAALALFLLDSLPLKLKGFISIAVLGGAFYLLYPALSGLSLLFSALFFTGGILHAFASMYRKNDRRIGYYPLFVLTVIALGLLPAAGSALQFFLLWETMAAGSYLLVLRGGDTKVSSQLYIGFSLGGAYLIMTGLLVAGGTEAAGAAAAVLLALGFLAKAGALGLHVWLPGAYGETEDDTSSFLSSVLSKAAIFGLMIFFPISLKLAGISAGAILGWIGIATVFIGALVAVFQEDIKYLLAYSSMSQVGYIILAVSLGNHFGWTTALYLTLNHFLFKAMLFLAAAGLIMRTGTRLMYKMGGLIKKMPVSFLSALIAIIALSGVPPLSGFGSKWLLYQGLIEKGWYLQAGFAFFSSGIAFLYLFRLIHAMFLGQLKTEHQNVKEAPVWLIVPQVALMISVIVISIFPKIVLEPFSRAVSAYFPGELVWKGGALLTGFGYWNATAIMAVTIGVFVVILLWLLFVMRRPRWVRQFNIVFAAERPDRPETTHFAYNFFAPYRKALGFLANPYAVGFWNGVTEGTGAVASSLRRLYSGNGQTYVLHILMYTVILYLIMGGF